jgi:hypothetical protein
MNADPGTRALAATTARLLGACACSIGWLGLGCAALAALALLARLPVATTPGPALVLAGVLLLAPLERVLALRLQFDAGLFIDLAAAAQTPAAALDTLDQALHRLRLRAPSPQGRSLSQRVGGARRLISWHAGTVVVQFAALGLATLWSAMGAGS